MAALRPGGEGGTALRAGRRTRGGEPLAVELEASAIARMTARHFAMQHAAPADIASLEVGRMDSLLRCLLFTDGTVTRTLEAQTLSSVEVEVLEQRDMPLPAHAARHLDAEATIQCTRRRVAMRTADSAPTVWAESHMLAERLPLGFLSLLDSTSRGIGGSIELSRLESRRELLWFGVGPPPAWAPRPAPSSKALVRLYRIVSGSLPALLILEAFAIERRRGSYCALACDSPAGASAAASLDLSHSP